MVFERLVPIQIAERRPWEMLPLAALYASVGVLLALWIFPDSASLACVFFGVMALMPLMVQLVLFEKKKGEQESDIETHKRAAPFFVFMFLGLVLCYAFWGIFLPYFSSVNLFQMQIIIGKNLFFYNNHLEHLHRVELVKVMSF